MSGVPALSSERVTSTAVSTVRAHAWAIAVWVAMVVWSVVLFAAMRDLFEDFRLARYDLGNMTQAVWSTCERPCARGHGRRHGRADDAGRAARRPDPRRAGALLDRRSVAPDARRRPDRRGCAGCSPGACGSAAGTSARSGTPRLLALAYLAYPWMAWVAMDGFHPLTLAIPLLLFGIWFLDSDRLLPFASVRVAAATCGELVGVWIAALGLWYAFARGRRRCGSRDQRRRARLDGRRRARRRAGVLGRVERLLQRVRRRGRLAVGRRPDRVHRSP